MVFKIKKPSQADWQKNWGSSIAVKVTAPVFWILISVGLIIATVIQNKFADELPNLIASDADRVAYAASKYLLELEGGQPLDLQNVIEKSMKSTYFVAGEITAEFRTVKLGVFNVSKNQLEKITRFVPYTNKLEGGDSLIAKLTLYHHPYQYIIKANRKNMLVSYGITFFLFGLLLASLIHAIVTKPIFNLVSAIKAVSKGDMSSRLIEDRQDEFGELTSLFNKMLDKLQNKQEELTLAVNVAESASNAKSAFLTNMSHEIRTPLTAILGFSGLLKEGNIPGQQMKQYADSIIRAGNHLHQIINDILDMSKIEAGQLVIDNNAVNLFDLLKDIEYLMRPNAEEKQLTFRIKYAFPLPKIIFTDPTRLKQIMLNLCSNSIKFTSEGNVDIAISYDKAKAHLQFDVTDTGVGMSQAEVDRLFIPFSQADNSITRQYGGSGLGLSICKELVNHLGGEIECQSRKGIGSRFSFTINPGVITEDNWVYNLSSEQIAAVGPLMNVEPGSLHGRVLLAEDTLDNQRLISMYIIRSGAIPIVVENGKQALDAALKENFDLIIMDMQMPVMGGLDATAKLRASGYTGPIVALTANALREDREKSQQAGIDVYLTKPVDISRFNMVLTAFLKKKSNGKLPSPTEVPEFATVEFADDPEYKLLQRQFESELPNKLNAIYKYASQKNWQELKSLAHKLKGLGSSFGYPELSDIAEKIQIDLKKQNYQGIEYHIQQLKLCFHTTHPLTKKSSNF